MRYAGIGSRDTPLEVLETMTSLAQVLGELGYILRSGGADGADAAFYAGASKSEIFTPWRSYNHWYDDATVVQGEDYENYAAKFHPAWNKCSEGAKKLHARNVAIILGETGREPVDFVVCWTKDGGPTGGTGLGIRIAQHHNIPVFNLYYEDCLQKLSDFIYK